MANGSIIAGLPAEMDYRCGLASNDVNFIFLQLRISPCRMFRTRRRGYRTLAAFHVKKRELTLKE